MGAANRSEWADATGSSGHRLRLGLNEFAEPTIDLSLVEEEATANENPLGASPN